MNKQQMYPRPERTPRDPDQLGITVDMMIDDTGRFCGEPQLLDQLLKTTDDDSAVRLRAAMHARRDFEGLLAGFDEAAIEKILELAPKEPDPERCDDRQRETQYGAAVHVLRECGCIKSAIHREDWADAMVAMCYLGQYGHAMYASQFINDADRGRKMMESASKGGREKYGGSERRAKLNEQFRVELEREMKESPQLSYREQCRRVANLVKGDRKSYKSVERAAKNATDHKD